MVNNLNYAALGKRIREERMRQGISIEALAHRADISYVHMSHIETDDTKVSLPALVSIANALNVTTDFILYDSLFLYCILVGFIARIAERTASITGSSASASASVQLPSKSLNCRKAALSCSNSGLNTSCESILSA